MSLAVIVIQRLFHFIHGKSTIQKHWNKIDSVYAINNHENSERNCLRLVRLLVSRWDTNPEELKNPFMTRQQTMLSFYLLLYLKACTTWHYFQHKIDMEWMEKNKIEKRKILFLLPFLIRYFFFHLAVREVSHHTIFNTGRTKKVEPTIIDTHDDVYLNKRSYEFVNFIYIKNNSKFLSKYNETENDNVINDAENTKKSWFSRNKKNERGAFHKPKLKLVTVVIFNPSSQSYSLKQKASLSSLLSTMLFDCWHCMKLSENWNSLNSFCWFCFFRTTFYAWFFFFLFTYSKPISTKN